MDRLKVYIDAHRTEFDALHRPEPGHRARFEGALESRNAARARSSVGKRHLIAAAVSLAVVVAGALFFARPYQAEESVFFANEGVSAAEIRSEMEETEQYYIIRISDLAGEIDRLASTCRTCEPFAEIAYDSKAVLEDCHDFKENISPSLPTSETSLAAVDSQYGTALKMLTAMRDRLLEFNCEQTSL